MMLFLNGYSFLYVGYAQLDLNDNTTRSLLRYNITDINNSVRSNFSETMPLLFTNNSHTNSLVNQISLVITSNALLPQNSYRFKFTTYNEFGNSGFAEVDIYTESVPISGRILISPQTGSPLTTIFSLSAPGWTDNFGDTPLLYQFGLRYIFMEQSSNSRHPLPSCCNLLYDNSLFSSNVSCVCDFFGTGVSEQNDLQTMLPFLPQAMNRLSIQTELLVHVFDKNGARTEASKDLGSIFTEPLVTDDDSTQLLQPMEDSAPRKDQQLDTLAMLDGFQQLSRSNWRDALAQLTALVSFAEVTSFSSPYFNLSQAEITQFKLKAIGIVLDIYELYIPHSKPYLSVIASLLHSTTSSVNSLNDETISRIIDFIRVLIDSYNNFDVEQIFSFPGFSTTESQIVLKILQNLINTGNGRTSDRISRIRANSVTQEVLDVIPKLGFGLCTSERHSFVNNGASSLFLKPTRANLPSNYQSIEQCSARQANSKRAKACLSEDAPRVVVNFSSALFERYLWWPCVASSGNAESELYCSGVCLTSAQHTQNLLWQGREYEARLRSPLFQLYLLNPRNGSILEATADTLLIPTRISRNVAPDSEHIELVFPIVVSYSNASNLQCAYWNGTSRTWIRRSHFTGGMKLRNGTVTDVVCQFGATLGSIFTVLEVCPDGYYGDICSNGKRAAK